MEPISSLKRQREEAAQVDEDVLKRQKSYKDIITLLEEEEDEPTEDLSSLISTLQEEISSPSSSLAHNGPGPAHDLVSSGLYEPDQENPLSGSGSGSGEEDGENVMRHLLEASDDELGLPNTTTATTSSSDGFEAFDEVVAGQMDGGDFFFPVGGEGLWEFEDHEAANYYSLLQSSNEILL